MRIAIRSEISHLRLHLQEGLGWSSHGPTICVRVQLGHMSTEGIAPVTKDARIRNCKQHLTIW
jgi:hypothetical protein